MTDDQTTDDQATTAPHQIPEPPPVPPASPLSGQPAAEQLRPAPPPPAGSSTTPPPPPAWRPPPADHGRSVSVILGLILLVIGGWFFATQTLGLDLPRLDWGQLWPLLLIVAGIWIVWRSMRRAR